MSSWCIGSLALTRFVVSIARDGHREHLKCIVPSVQLSICIHIWCGQEINTLASGNTIADQLALVAALPQLTQHDCAAILWTNVLQCATQMISCATMCCNIVYKITIICVVLCGPVRKKKLKMYNWCTIVVQYNLNWQKMFIKSSFCHQNV